MKWEHKVVSSSYGAPEDLLNKHGAEGWEFCSILETRLYCILFFKRPLKVPVEKCISDGELLKENEWSIECETPLMIRHKDGSFATGQAAQIVIDSLHEKMYG